jgi:phospholipid/cholesterol/gamma-HCH transport system ATP-binding protein
MKNALTNIKTLPDNRKTLIVIENLFKNFGSNKVLTDFNLKVFEEENVVILGKSGCGKSVLIKCIIGLIKPEKGRIFVFATDITLLESEKMDAMRTKIGFLFQSNAIYDSMTIRENLEFPLRRSGSTLSQEQINALVIEALENVKLSHTIDMMPSEMSGGMLKRIALARIMILKPKIILYDEPTSGLDPVTAREIEDLILKVRKKYHTTSIIISHDMNCVKKTADRVVLLLDGKCYSEGTYADFENSDDHNIKQFFL